MTGEQWSTVWRIATSAREVPTAEWRAFIESQTSDPEVAREVTVVLETTQDEGLFARTPIDRTGIQVGRYQVGNLLGRGAMGEVYAGRDTDLGRPVALKFLTAGMGDPSAVRRFIREAKAASALNHPNILTVYEVIQSSSGLAMVMELVEGTVVSEFRGTALPVPHAIALGRQVAGALSTAHDQSIVHRDVKPENLMVRPDGLVKVLDFGLAQDFAGRLAATLQPSAAALPAGTLRYMSPEQLRDEPITGASDVFSLGLVLYELAAGRHPFESEFAWETAHAIHTRESSPPSSVNGQVPAWLDELILSMLQRNPSLRPSARQVESSLASSGAAMDARWPHTPSLPQKVRAQIFSRAALILGASALVVLASILLYGRARSATREFSFANLTTNDSENRVTAAAISSDGTWVTYADSNGMWLRALKGGAPQSLPSPQELRAERIAWFPDGLRLVVSGLHTTTLRPEIWIISTDGKNRLLRESARNGTPSPDGTQVAMTRNQDTEIWVESATGGEPRRVLTGSEGDTFPFLLWSPDGKRLIYQRQRKAPLNPGRPPYADLAMDWHWDYESADALSGKVLASQPDVRFHSAGILASGRLYLLRRMERYGPGSLWEVDTDAAGAFRSAPRMVRALRGNTSGLTVSANGAPMAMVSKSSQFDIFVANLAAGPRLEDARRLTLDLKAGYPHAWTIDSQAVIFESNRLEQYHLYVQRTDQRTAETISPTAMDELLPQSSPDGKWLLYAGTTRGFNVHDFSLFRKPIAGGTAVRVAIQGMLDEFRCPLSGSDCVLRQTVGQEEYRYYRLDPIAGQGPELARTAWLPLMRGTWDVAPDGSAVAIPNHDPGNRKIRLVPLAAGGVRLPEREIPVEVTGPLSSLAWAADGKGWFVATQNDGESTYSLWYVSLQGQTHFLRETGVSTWPVPSPDGRKLAFIDQTGDGNVWLLR